MIDVKKPVLLDEHLQDSELLYPVKGSLKLEMTNVSEATRTLCNDAEGLPMHAWVKMYNQFGFVGIFRRTSRNNNITVDKTYTLRHGIDILQDSVYAAETEFSGTKAEFITALLNQQTQLIQGPEDNSPRKPWVLGSCADTSSYTKSINYDNLLDLLLGLVDDSSGYYFTYDQTVWPWTVSLVAKTNDVKSEFRLSRNIDKCKIKDNDSELCTRLILNVNEMVNDTELAQKTGKTVKQNESVIRTYDNTAAQANYGIIVKTADIDVTADTFPNGPFPEADAWAADFLARRAAPQLQVQIDGFVLKKITNEDWDESKIGTVCRVSLSDYPAPIDERTVTITYPDLYDVPDKVTVSLANALPTLTKSMSSTQKTVDQTVKGGRGSARQAESFEQHFKITDDSGNIIKQAGMSLDANGLLVYAEDLSNDRYIGSKFKVQANAITAEVTRASQAEGELSGKISVQAGRIDLVVTGSGSSASINIDAIGDALNGSSITISADRIDLDGVVENLQGMYVSVGELNVGASGMACEGDFDCDGDIGAASLSCPDGELYVGTDAAEWKSVAIYHITSLSNNYYFAHVASTSGTTVTGATYGMIVRGATTTTINYLGK